MRLLSIDYGKRRTGIAVSDPLQLIANGLMTIETKQLLVFLKDYIKKEQVEKFIIGLPIQPNGQPSENYARVQGFARQLATEIPEIPIEFYDERFTSVLAQRAMIDSGIGKKKRRNKALVDEISATIILQNYMESRKTF